jgi:hypothetical protein
MNAEIKERWVAALRGGLYPQTSGSLRDNFGYCCLGVLCDIVDPEKWEQYGTSFGYENHTAFPPIGLRQDVGLDARVEREAASMNDNGSSFPEIADFLEKNA